MSCSIAMSCGDAFSSAVAVMVGGVEGVVGRVGWCGRVNVVVAILVGLVVVELVDWCLEVVEMGTC